MKRQPVNSDLKNFSRVRQTVRSAPGNLFLDVVQTITSPLGVVVIWSLIFSVLFNIDVFTHLALAEKSKEIATIHAHSEHIVVVEFDALAKSRVSDNIDNLTGIFNLVDKIFASSNPKQIILDYELINNETPNLPFNSKYLDKLTWGVVPYWRGEDYLIQGVAPGIFSYPDKITEYRVEGLIKPWGHLMLGLTPGTTDAISFIELIQYRQGNLIPSLALTSFVRGEYQLNIDELMFMHKGDGETPNCKHEAFTNLPSCAKLTSPQLFYTPPLPRYFASYPAFEILNSEQNTEISNTFDNKYVFISSTWDKHKDHYLSSVSTGSGAVSKIFGMLDVVQLQQSDGKVPGVYFHASILESLLNPSIGHPSISGVFYSVVISFPAILLVILLSLGLRKFLVSSNKPVLQERHFWIIFMLVATFSFPVFKEIAVYAVIKLDTLVNLMGIYLFTVLTASFLIAGDTRWQAD
ncbi:CHASE2 domain-containing protein [Rheinheimera muenzenbergensis]|uniref:CHASE2 domain-containing protein n=1 Tax=Rheinheimera muenzenbergensis TaxID=1193628 RepID=A0ABU8C8Z2_9GAMM